MLRTRRRRKSRSKSRRRRNPSMSRRRRSSPRRRHNPRMSRRRRTTRRRRNPSYSRVRAHRRRRRNPSFASIRRRVDTKLISTALLTAGGLIVGTKSASVISNLPVVGRAGRFLGAVNLLLGAVLAGFVKNPHARAALVGFAAGGAYNLVAKNVSALGISEMSGDELLGVEVGGDEPLVALRGVEVGEEPYVVMAGEGQGSFSNGMF